MQNALTWETAESLEDFAWLTSYWLTGRGLEHPVYGKAPGPGIEDVATDLGVLNRHGIVTMFAQGGYTLDPEEGYAQRAVVGAFAAESTARRLGAVTLRADLLVFLYEPGGTGGYQVPVTMEGFRPTAWSGAAWGEEELETFAQVCSPEGLEALRSAWRIVAIDPKWGRKAALWQDLRHAANPENVQGPFSITPPQELGLDTDFVR